MSTYTVHLTKKETHAEGTMAFYFEKPNNFSYKAGQYIDLTLIDPPETDTEGNRRSFSLASAPYETELMIATRMRDTAMKRVLRDLPIGSSVKIDGPMGNFTLHNDTTRGAVFLMGGIGITPARSILLQAAHDQTAHHLVLFYSNRRPEDAAFLAELQELSARNTKYTCVGTMTEMAKSKLPWSGEKKFIDATMVSPYIANIAKPIFYISGPPAMVATMRQVLTGMHINDDDIQTEEFSGY